jgi:ribosome-associated protein
MLPNSPLVGKKEAVEIGQLLTSHHGGDVVVMDLRGILDWTDFFVISTVTSSAHLSGLERHIKDFVRERELPLPRRSRRPASDDEWCLLDLGSIVIHLMTDKMRTFYELERLLHEAPVIYSSSSSPYSTSS